MVQLAGYDQHTYPTIDSMTEHYLQSQTYMSRYG